MTAVPSLYGEHRFPMMHWYRYRTYAILVEIEKFSTYRLIEPWRKLGSPNFHSKFHSSLIATGNENRPKPKRGIGLSPFAKTNDFQFCYENYEIIPLFA